MNTNLALIDDNEVEFNFVLGFLKTKYFLLNNSDTFGAKLIKNKVKKMDYPSLNIYFAIK